MSKDQSRERNVDVSRLSRIGYDYAHTKVYRARGRAAEQECKDCAGQASQWAYVPGDANEQVDTSVRHIRGEVKTLVLKWSANVWAYDPLCVPCHRKRDSHV